MKVGPVSFPVSNVSEVLGFVILVALTIYALRTIPGVPAQVKP